MFVYQRVRYPIIQNPLNPDENSAISASAVVDEDAAAPLDLATAAAMAACFRN